MNYFRNPGAGLDEQEHAGTESDELLHRENGADTDAASRQSLGEVAGRVARWFQGFDPEPMDGQTVEHDMLAELGVDEEPALEPYDHAPDQSESRFELVRYGYSQAEVDRALSDLERQLADRDREIKELRDNQPPMSISEELERIGEQTASILVVAHDQAHETTRRAQEQAEQCIADAAANAVQITAEAKERLRELDDETETVWRERERLLDDTRSVSRRLATVVDDAVRRFPAAADKSAASESR